MSEFRIIFTLPEDGGVCIIIPAPGITRQAAAQAVPAGVAYDLILADDLPADRTFRNAWERSGSTVVHNLVKCKAIAHKMRRAARALEFAPLDVRATIPNVAIKAEEDRQTIRERYETIQADIDAAVTVQQLKEVAVLLRVTVDS